MLRYVLFAMFVAASPVAAQVPHEGDHFPHDPDLYREMVYGIRATSLVLEHVPRFYVQTHGPSGCNSSRRVSFEMAHYWRAIVPILHEQITGQTYPYRVEVGCHPRPAAKGWVIVKHLTATEYEQDPDRAGAHWPGSAQVSLSTVGAPLGRIWFRYDERFLRRSPVRTQLFIAHEIGHVYGFAHTSRAGTTMTRVVKHERPFFQLLSPEEEREARAAYRAGRGATYCGNPDHCFGLRGPDWGGLEVAVD